MSLIASLHGWAKTWTDQTASAFHRLADGANVTLHLWHTLSSPLKSGALRDKAMDAYWWWAIGGIALIIAELITGTFYLLVLGIAALAGAAVAWLHYSFGIQALIAADIAISGVALVTRFRQNQSSSPGMSLDVGQSVVLDEWVNEADGLARVRYRDAVWDAKVIDQKGAEAGRPLYIKHVDGNTLHVSAIRPG